MYRRATWEVVKFRSTRGLPLATRALARRSMVPPTSNSTGIPVFAVNGLATIRSTVSFQFPPQILTTSGSAAWAPEAPASRAIGTAITIPNLIPNLIQGRMRAPPLPSRLRAARAARSLRSSHDPGRLGDRLYDEMVAGAAAEVARKHLADLLVARRRGVAEEGLGGEDDARRAKATLQSMF